MLKSMEETSTHKSLKPGKPAPTTAPLPLMYRATKPPGKKARIRVSTRNRCLLNSEQQQIVCNDSFSTYVAPKLVQSLLASNYTPPL